MKCERITHTLSSAGGYIFSVIIPRLCHSPQEEIIHPEIIVGGAFESIERVS